MVISFFCTCKFCLSIFFLWKRIISITMHSHSFLSLSFFQVSFLSHLWLGLFSFNPIDLTTYIRFKSMQYILSHTYTANICFFLHVCIQSKNASLIFGIDQSSLLNPFHLPLILLSSIQISKHCLQAKTMLVVSFQHPFLSRKFKVKMFWPISFGIFIHWRLW